jgi:hypothetical protein
MPSPRQPARPQPSNLPAPTAAPALPALPPEIARELLQSQAEQIQTPPTLPRITVLPQGVNQYEFKDTQQTTAEFEAVILYTHPRNTMWDKNVEEGRQSDETENGPACTSRDGITGYARTGFPHVMLTGPATGAEEIPCATCRYNQFNSLHLLPNKRGNPKGKACSNQRAVYVAFPDRPVPMVLSLSATSMAALDEYLTALTAAGIPQQAVVTKFKLERKQPQGSNLRYSVVVFERGRFLNQEEFNGILAMRREYAAPLGLVLVAAPPMGSSPPAQGMGQANRPEPLDADDPDLPF